MSFQFNVLDSERAQAVATLDVREAARDLAAINRIASPVDGMASERLARPGHYVSGGSQAISVRQLPDV